MAETKALKTTNDEAGTFTQQVLAGDTTIHLTPVPAKAPGVFTAEPGTAKEEHIYFKTRDAVGGTVAGCVRDYTNLNGGVGQQHENGEDWETLQAAEYINNLVDIIQEGFYEEYNTIARVDAATFTVQGNRTQYYAANRILRVNKDDNNIAIVASSSYSAGTGLTTVIINYGTVTNPLTSIELAIQPTTATALFPSGASIQAGSANYALTAGSSNAYTATLSPVPSTYVTGQRVYLKLNFTNTAAPTINLNSLGAKNIKLPSGMEVPANFMRNGALVELMYDGTNFQLLSISESPEWVDLTDGATVTIDLSLGRKFRLKSIGGNRSFVFSNIPSLTGFMFLLQITQDGTGGRTWTPPTGDSTFATTDVDTSTDIITVGRDIPTGTPIKFSSTTTVPGGLTAGTKYYAVRQSATTIKVASSLANAQAGTTIDLTSQGTGTHTILALIRWPGDSEPSLSTGKYKSDTFGFELTEAKVFRGFVVGQDN